MSSRQWRLLEHVLSARWRVLAPDLLGSGASPPWCDDARFDLQMDVDAILASLPVTGPLHLVGHSYGAFLALKIAQQRPKLVRSLSLYEPTAFGILHEPDDREALAELRSLERGTIFTDEDAGGTEPWLKVFVDYWNGTGSWERMPEPSRAAFLRVGRKMYREVRSIMADRTGMAAYRRVQAPTLLMSGGRTPVAERRVMVRLAEALPSATSLKLENAGHMGPLTHAADVNDAIALHLAFVG
jgi:pimeloyl-ACP methyl ester carboxylesterase